MKMFQHGCVLHFLTYLNVLHPSFGSTNCLLPLLTEYTEHPHCMLQNCMLKCNYYI